MAFFAITNVEYDIIHNNSTTDVYAGAMMGELGCWVVPAITRMVQTGVQHAWVPDYGLYFGPGRF